MTQLERFEAALAEDQELPVLTATEFADLVVELAASDLSEFNQREILESGRYFGRGFGVDYTL